MKKRQILRRVVQALSIFFFFYLLKKTTVYPVSTKLPLSFFFKIDGLLAFSVAIITKTMSLFILPGFVMILLIMTFGNFFCTWICPSGGIIDYLGFLFFRKRWKISSPVPGKLRNASSIILMFVLISAVVSSISGIQFFGFVFDPFVIMHQAMIGTILWLSVFLIIVLASIFYPRLWCNCFCPLGKFYTIAGTRFKIKKLFVMLKNRRKTVS